MEVLALGFDCTGTLHAYSYSEVPQDNHQVLCCEDDSCIPDAFQVHGLVHSAMLVVFVLNLLLLGSKYKNVHCQYLKAC